MKHYGSILYHILCWSVLQWIWYNDISNGNVGLIVKKSKKMECVTRGPVIFTLQQYIIKTKTIAIYCDILLCAIFQYFLKPYCAEVGIALYY